MKGDVLPILALLHTESRPLTSPHTLTVQLECAPSTWGDSWFTRRLHLLRVQPFLLLLVGQPVLAGPYPGAPAQRLQASCLLAALLPGPPPFWGGGEVAGRVCCM